MGSRVPPTESFGRQNADKERTERDVRDALRIDGSQFVRLYEKMKALIDNLVTTVTDLVNAITYTRVEVDSRIASGDAAVSAAKVSKTGDTMTGDLNTSGRVISAAPIRSLGARSYVVSTGYAGLWIESDGTIGISPSTGTLKKNLSPMSDVSPAGIDAAQAILDLTPYWGHYVWDDDGEPLKAFLIAEQVYEAGFGPDVAPTGEDGEPFTLNYSQLVPALIAALQAEVARGVERDARLDAAGL